MIANSYYDNIYMFKMLNTIKEQDIIKLKTYSFISKWKECQSFIEKISGKKPLFILVIGSTETALIPGISAAGKNINDLKHTPALDAEFLVLKKEKFKKQIPVSPSGIASPVIISKAITDLLDLDICVVDVGAFIMPECNHISLNMGPAKCLTKGKALSPVQVDFLFQKAEKLATKLVDFPYFVIGECVPGGTTTALSVLCALGIDAFGLINSSFPEGNHFFKNQTVKEALLDHASAFTEIKKDPLKAAEFFGDPMQVFISGFIKGIQKIEKPIMLAGGSQMVAVYYLSRMILDYHPHDVAISTTSWIANDKNANIKKLGELTGAPIIYSRVNFADSKHNGLTAYEKGHIKEGVGAGGLMTVADLYKNFSQEEITNRIEDFYLQVHPQEHC